MDYCENLLALDEYKNESSSKEDYILSKCYELLPKPVVGEEVSVETIEEPSLEDELPEEEFSEEEEFSDDEELPQDKNLPER